MSARDCRIRKKQKMKSLENKVKEYIEKEKHNKIIIKNLTQQINNLEVQLYAFKKNHMKLLDK